MVRERVMRVDLRRLTEGKLHVRDFGNHKLIGLGINPQSQVQTPVSKQDRALVSL